MTINKNIQYIFIFALLSISLSSCEEFFIKELEVPRQDLDNRLVVHAFVSSEDSLLEFKVARNFDLDAVFEESESLVSGANIKIFRSGELIEEITGNSDNQYLLDMGKAFDGVGESYRVEIINPEYELAYVETEMPEYVMPQSVKFTKEGGFSGPGNDKLDLIQITFDDPADEVNYYEFQIHQILVDSEEFIFGEDTVVVETRYPDDYFTPDTNFEMGISGFLLSDQIFNGQTYTFSVMLSGIEELDTIPVDKLRITWNCISKDHFEYSKSLLQYQRSSGFGLFSDPVAVFSNVENGLGVVSFRSSREIEVQE